MSAAPIYVVLSSTGGDGFSSGRDGSPKHPGGPIVMETEIGAGSTLEKARERAAQLDAQARVIRGNVATFQAEAAGFEFLFADLATFVHKAADDFKALVTSRIATHKANEERKARERAEAEARAAEQQRLASQAAARLAAEAAAKASAATPAPAPAPMAAAPVAPVPAPALATTAPRADEPATLKLGVICERLGFTVTSAFVADVLHVKPAKVEGNRPGLYTEAQFRTICSQLQAHVSAMAELYTAEVAA